MVLVAHRRETDAAVAEQDRGDTVPGRRRQHRIPRRLPIVMRVDVDPAGRDQQAVSVYLTPAGASLAADLGDLVAVECYVAGVGRLAGSIDDVTASDHGVMHGSLPFLFFRGSMGSPPGASVKFCPSAALSAVAIGRHLSRRTERRQNAPQRIGKK